MRGLCDFGKRVQHCCVCVFVCDSVVLGARGCAGVTSVTPLGCLCVCEIVIAWLWGCRYVGVGRLCDWVFVP